MPATPATYYDGCTALPRRVLVEFRPEVLAITEGEAPAIHWRYADMRRLEAGQGTLRLRNLVGPDLARLEVQDPGFEAELAGRCPCLDEARGTSARTLMRIVGLSLAAAASLVASVVFLVPVAADRLAPLVPPAVEQRLGDAVDGQVRALFGAEACGAPEGRAALAKLRDQLAAKAASHVPVEITILSSGVPNAVALPGGRIYLFKGMLGRAENPDEVAGVLAHEIGHVVNRDGLRGLIQAGGSSFLIGLLFGDVSGSGAVILATRALIDSAYTREAESAADAFAADLMLALGRSPKPMGELLFRITGSQRGDKLAFLNSHPVTDDRLATLTSRDRPARGAPLLTEAEWRALKDICGKG